jgi:ABC-type transport system involved in multi-copper enzyme maturation permease subunit
MKWLVWRQYRVQFIIALVVLGLFTIVTVTTGLHLSHAYRWALTHCTQTNTCSRLNTILFQGDAYLFTLMAWSGVAMPFLFGLFLGVPLIAREYEDGTNKLVWTQSVPRRRWLTIKLLLILFASVAYAAAVTALVTWWSKTGNALYGNRFTPFNFDGQGYMPVALSPFAVSLGIAVGAWLKRVLPALALTLAILVSLQIAVPLFIRPYYQTPDIYTISLGGDNGDNPTPGGAVWIISKKQVDYHGHLFNPLAPPDQCLLSSTIHYGEPPKVPAVSENNGPLISVGCITDLGYHWLVKYQPAYRYWNFQRIEAAIYLGLTAIPVVATYWFVLRRDA